MQTGNAQALSQSYKWTIEAAVRDTLRRWNDVANGQQPDLLHDGICQYAGERDERDPLHKHRGHKCGVCPFMLVLGARCVDLPSHKAFMTCIAYKGDRASAAKAVLVDIRRIAAFYGLE